jgi:hypothetical protein
MNIPIPCDFGMGGSIKYFLGVDYFVNFVGDWRSFPFYPNDTVDEQLILLSDGTGVFAEYNWILLHVTEIIWHFDGDVLTVTAVYNEKKELYIL